LFGAWAIGLDPAASERPVSQKSDPLCPHIVACEYEAPAFTIRVVDQQTGQPLADVHAIASWVMYGGNRRGVLMALEAVTGPDGLLFFSGWGPVRSGVAGLMPGDDPLISLFRSGYRTKLIHNVTLPIQPHTARLRPFNEAGETFMLDPVPDTLSEKVAELGKAADPFDGTALAVHDLPSMRALYVNRLKRVRSQAERLPRHLHEVEQLFWRLDSGIRLFERGG
jgi:hypothetical protein